VGGDVLEGRLLALAHAALAHPSLVDESEGMRAWRHGKSPPPDALFLADDIYTSAYLSRRGVPRVVVPRGDSNQAAAPVSYLTRAASAPPMPSQPPRSAKEPALAEAAPIVGAIDTLHDVAVFDAINVAVVRVFEQAGWWGAPRWPL
jgi:hypothetical protein